MKRLPRPDLTAAEAARIGEELREARLALGITIEDASQRLRINRRYLNALEEGRIRDLPGPAYAVGFIRSYAGALGLDVDEMVRRFRDVTGSPAQKNADLVFPEPVPSRGVPAGVVVGLGAVLVVAGYVAWYNWSGVAERTVDTVPPLPPRLEQTAELGERIRDPDAAPSAAAPALAPEAAPPPPPEPPPRLVLRARGDTSVVVRDGRANNEVILDRVMRTGDSVPLPNRDGLLLTVGLAQNLDVIFEGQPSPILANATGQRRNLPLDADRLRPRAPARPAAGNQVPPAPPRPAPVANQTTAPGNAAPPPARPPAGNQATAPGNATPPAARPPAQPPAAPAAAAPTPAPRPATPAPTTPPAPRQADPPPGTFVPFTGNATR